MPLFARSTANERDGLLTSLAQQRDGLCAMALGLSDDQARLAPLRGDLSIAGLIKHCLRTERR
jgi:hypothetical protein